jgi:flagellar motility protein MotE (MotC chaperone)
MGNLSIPEWMCLMGRAFFTVFFVIQLIALNLMVFYFGGMRRYGTPSEFRARQEEKAKASRDSVRLAELEILAPENAGDSTMYDLGNHIRLFEQTKQHEQQIRYLQAMIDSLEREKTELEKLRETVSRERELLKTVQSQAATENLAGLAKMFEAMKPQEAIPVMRELDDSLAVNILTRMQSRNSAKLLGAMATADTVKAVRLSKLLARMSPLEEK